MCGLFGANSLSLDPGPYLELMAHRGPDDSGVVQQDGWTLGHLRLSIIDLQSRSAQPFKRDGALLAFNGELYNYEELRERFLSDEEFQTSSDTEVLIAMLNRFGESALEQFNGMFAIAWLDSQGELWLFRDRFGVKPLYYAIKEGVLYFSSELKPLLTEIGHVVLHGADLKRFLESRATDGGEGSGFRGVYSLPPGYRLRASLDARIELAQWYRLPPRPVENVSTSSDLLDIAEDLLVESIKLRSKADAPVCISLSGGIDSSLIFVLMKERLGLRVQPFVYQKRDDPSDEAQSAVKLARAYDEEPVVVQQSEDLSNIFVEAISRLEYPTWSLAPLAYFEFYEEVQCREFRVIIEGHGSDELFGGYSYMVEAAIGAYLRKGFLGIAASLLPIAARARLGTPGNFGIRLLVEQFRALINAGLAKNKDFQAVLDFAFSDQVLPIVLRTFDRASMAYSLESRMPFLDFRFVEFARSVPVEEKVSELGTKALLRKILMKYGVHEIASRKQKIGFGADQKRLVTPAFRASLENLARFAPISVQEWAKDQVRWPYSERRSSDALAIAAMFGVLQREFGALWGASD